MGPTELYPILALVSLVTVEYGGWALLSFISAPNQPLGPFRERFFRAGHAHAGGLLVLALVYCVYLERTTFSEGLQWLAGGAMLVGVLIHSGGFFVHMAVGEEGKPTSTGTAMARGGAIVIAVALLALAGGLIDAA